MIRRCQYCGKENNILLLQFRLLLREKVYHRCNCGKVSSYMAITHIVHDTTDSKEKEHNRLYDAGKGVWKNA